MWSPIKFETIKYVTIVVKSFIQIDSTAPKMEMNFNFYYGNIRNAPQDRHKYKEGFGFW